MDGISALLMGIALLMALVWMIADARQYRRAHAKRNHDRDRTTRR